MKNITKYRNIKGIKSVELHSALLLKNDVTDLVAHGEEIMQDLLDCFPNIKNEKFAMELTEFVQRYIEAAVEVAIDNPAWFE